MNKVESALQSLEERWALALPEAFRRLYRRFEEPYISPCEFLTLGELLNDAKRLEQLKQNALRIAKPQAAFDVARLALRYAKASGKIPMSTHRRGG